MSDTPEPQDLDGIEDSVPALADIISNARRELCIYTPIIQPGLYDAPDVAAALRQAIISSDRLQVRLLLPETRSWRHSCSHLSNLIERLSAIELRHLPPTEPCEEAEFALAIVIADEQAMLRHTDPRRCIGKYHASGSADARRLLGFFKTYWELSLRDTELRPLGI